MKKIESIKQLQFPKEFRIVPLVLSEDLLNNLENLIAGLTKEQIAPAVKEVRNETNLNFVAELAVGVWRMKKRMVDRATNQPFEDMKRTYRHLESVIFAMEKEGIEIQDHDNNDFDSGLSLKVLTFQPTPGLKKETIIDTIKPTIYFKGERIVMGEVIVGTPTE